MLERVLRERPTVERVRTGNAVSSAAMLRINEELGFKPYKTIGVWQVKVEKVLAYLARRPVWPGRLASPSPSPCCVSAAFPSTTAVA
jgi:hypothetical protein